MRIDGVSAIAVILIASFAIDRVATGLLFLFSYFRWWSKIFPDPQKEVANKRTDIEKRHKLIYFVVSGILGIGVLGWYGKIRILSVSGFPDADPWLDTIVTGLILVGGADRVATFLNMQGSLATQRSVDQPVQITGSLTIEDADGGEERSRSIKVRPGGPRTVGRRGRSASSPALQPTPAAGEQA